MKMILIGQKLKVRYGPNIYIRSTITDIDTLVKHLGLYIIWLNICVQYDLPNIEIKQTEILKRMPHTNILSEFLWSLEPAHHNEITPGGSHEISIYLNKSDTVPSARVYIWNDRSFEEEFNRTMKMIEDVKRDNRDFPQFYAALRERGDPIEIRERHRFYLSKKYADMLSNLKETCNNMFKCYALDSVDRIDVANCHPSQAKLTTNRVNQYGISDLMVACVYCRSITVSNKNEILQKDLFGRCSVHYCVMGHILFELDKNNMYYVEIFKTLMSFFENPVDMFKLKDNLGHTVEYYAARRYKVSLCEHTIYKIICAYELDVPSHVMNKVIQYVDV
jgi:hypothetical protein